MGIPSEYKMVAKFLLKRYVVGSRSSISVIEFFIVTAILETSFSLYLISSLRKALPALVKSAELQGIAIIKEKGLLNLLNKVRPH